MPKPCTNAGYLSVNEMLTTYIVTNEMKVQFLLTKANFDGMFLD